MSSGFSRATCSMSTPPRAEPMNVIALDARSTSAERYSSFSMSVASLTSTSLTGSARPPDWYVVIFVPSIFAAASRASSGVLTSLTPPALPRPPAWICALTTKSPPPIDFAAARASSPLRTARPAGTGMPTSANSSFAWYSWKFMRVLAEVDAKRAHARSGAPRYGGLGKNARYCGGRVGRMKGSGPREPALYWPCRNRDHPRADRPDLDAPPRNGIGPQRRRADAPRAILLRPVPGARVGRARRPHLRRVAQPAPGDVAERRE